MNSDEPGDDFSSGRIGRPGVIAACDDPFGIVLRESGVGVDQGGFRKGIQRNADSRERELGREVVDDFEKRVTVGDARDRFPQVGEIVKAKIG